jgi:hypothetical protein
MTRCGYGCPQAPAEWPNSLMLFASHGSISNLRLRGARGSYRLIDCKNGSGDHQFGAGEPALAAAVVEQRFVSLEPVKPSRVLDQDGATDLRVGHPPRKQIEEMPGVDRKVGREIRVGSTSDRSRVNVWPTRAP